MSNERKWSVSEDGEYFREQFDTLEEAVHEGGKYGTTFYVGQCVAPTPPEKLFDRDIVDQWIECVLEHEDYGGDWCDGPWAASRAQRVELAEQLQPVIATWLDRHGLRPTHWNIDPVTVRYIDPEAEKAR